MNEENTHHLPYFDEVNKMYTMREAIEEAKRCLHCKVPQCKRGCPIENNIPDFIHELSKGNMGEAMAILHEKPTCPPSAAVCAHTKSSAKVIACSAAATTPCEWASSKAL